MSKKTVTMYKVKYWTNDELSDAYRFSVKRLVTEDVFRQLLEKGKVIRYKKKKIKL